MASFFALSYTSEKTVYGILQQKSSAGLDDLWWETVTPSFLPSASSTLANKKLNFVEVATSLGFYSLNHSAAFSTYTGEAVMHYFDSTLIESIGSELLYFSAGELVSESSSLATIRTEWTNGGRLDTLLDTAAAGGSTTAISPVVVSPARTWSLTRNADAVLARNVVTLAVGSIVTVSFDFSKVLNLPESSLVSVTSVTDDLELLTIETLAVSQSRQCAHATITAGLAANNKHKLMCTVTTVDGQTIVAIGKLNVV